MTTSPRLRLRLDHRDETTEITLAPGERLRIGRGEASADDEGHRVHVVHGPLTSRRHATLGLDDTAWIEDLGSRNGVLVDDIPASPGQRVALHTGQRLEIGDALVEVVEAPPPLSISPVVVQGRLPGAGGSGLSLDSSLLPSPSGRGAGGEGGRGALAERAGLADVPEARLTAWLERDGALTLVASSDAALVLGRGHDVDVHLDDTTASRRHGRVGEAIERGARSPFVVEDLDSRGGTWLNGQRVLSTLPLTHGDTIGIGRHQARVVVDGAGETAQLSLVLRRERALPGLGSDPHDTGRALHVSGPTPGGGAHRRAPSWQPTSDLARPRRWPVVLGASAVVVVIGLLLDLAAPGAGIPARGSSVGPLSTPHVDAGLDCASCHAPQGVAADIEAPERQAACNGCHGPRTSMRAGHQRAAEAGALTCADCHQVHRSMEGLTFTGAGQWRWWRTGADDVTGTSEAFSLPPTLAAQTVALVPLTACARCHDAAVATDPIHRCIDRSLASPGLLAEVHAGTRAPDDEALAGALAMCFDEHQSHGLPRTELGDQHHVARPAIWEGARVLVAEAFAQRPQPRPESDWTALWWVLAAIVVPLGWAGLQATRRALPLAVDVTGPADEAVASAPMAGKRMVPRIDPLTCVGCSACVDACPYDVLALEQYVARAVRADMCCGIGSCEAKCPNGSLTIDVEDADPASSETPPLTLTLESAHRRGVFVAGDLTGLPLIKNAINQGAAAIAAVVDDLAVEDGAVDGVDVAIIGAGPAGLSAALACVRHGLSYRLLDQGEVAESIRSFPRGKLVFDQPMNLPVVGELWLRESTKEELLAQWLRVIADEGIEVSSYTRLETLAEVPGVTLTFEVGTRDPRTGDAHPTFRARRVVLCVGRRGSPRKLDVELPFEAEARVHYSLADAQSFAGKRCVVVGMGDVAMETAVALANQPGTRVAMSYRRPGYHSGARRNQRAVDELARAGLIDVHWSTVVERVGAREVVLRPVDGEETPITVGFDAVFVMIGGVPPRALLANLGVLTDRTGAPRSE